MTSFPAEVNDRAKELVETYKLTVAEITWDGKVLKIWGDYSDEYPCLIEAWMEGDWKREHFQLLGGGDDD